LAVIANGGERRAMLRVLLVGEAGQLRHQASAALSSLSDPMLEIAETDFAEKRTGELRPDVMIVLFNNNEEAALNYVQAQVRDPHPVLFALVQQRSSALMRRILHCGVDELLFLPLDPATATRALLTISESRRKSEHQPGSVILSLVSTVGGVGVTSLAANLALALRYTLNKRVAMIDLDLQTGGLGFFLNLEPDRTIMRLCESGRQLDSIQLEAALTKHSSGVYLLAAPKGIDESELVTERTIAAVLELMRQLFDFLVVDCGGYVDEHAVAAWERSDLLFYVLDQSIAAARSAWRFLDLFGRLGLAGIAPQLVLNRYRPHHPISEEHIASSLGRAVFAKIPRDEKSLERGQLLAQDLWQIAPGSPLVRAVEELARRIGSGGTSSQTKASAWPRLFSRQAGIRN
jgi:pilus assembly protein CpaE